MGNIDLGDLRKWIDELDKLLISGTLQYRAMYGDYSTARKNEGFDLAVYTEVGRKVWVEWQDKCFAIFEKLPRQHYAFHFAQTKSDGMSIMGWPDALSTVKMHFERQLHALEEIILWLEENEGLALRKEIADKEYQADIIYQIRYSEHSREIKLNNILLSKPDFDRENERCFGYIFANPGRIIGKAELEKVNGEPLKKPIKHILRDLGFVGDVAKIFTPGISEKSVEFVNPITKQYHYKHDLPILDFTSIGRYREKSGDAGQKSVK